MLEGLNTADIVVNKQTGIIRKQVRNLRGFSGGFSDVPTAADYQRVVGGCIDFLTDPRWGIAETIPDCRLSVVDSQKFVSGCECWVEMRYVQGKPLSELPLLPERTAGQLADFVTKCVVMAGTTRKEQGFVVLPDLLGGVKNLKGYLTNFVVEDGTDDLYFVDVYPLAELRSSRDKEKYSKGLLRIASKLDQPNVRTALTALANKINESRFMSRLFGGLPLPRVS